MKLGQNLPAVTPEQRKAQEDPVLRKAAEGMESMFLDYLMQVMRQTVPKNDLDLENPATQVYRSMLDSEYASIAAKRGGIGLADQIVAYMDTTRYNSNRSPTMDRGINQPHGGTGGTDEGQ